RAAAGRPYMTIFVAWWFLSVGSLVAATPLENHIRTLASDGYEGRGLGTKGLEKAATYIEAQLKAKKLQPVFGKSYRQKFPVKTGVALGANNSIDDLAKDDWTPLGFSSAGAFDGELVFAGYGIEAPPLNYRELEGLDLKGKVVLILRYEPQERDEKSPFDGKRPSRWSALRYKVLQARERGAAAVIFVTGPLQDEEKDKLPALANDGPESPAGIPVIQVKTSVAQKWIDLAQFQKDVDTDLKPRSRALGVKIKGNVDVKASYADAENVAGVIPGKGKLANEIVVVGAHYDHLGYGGQGSLKPNVKAIHNGADDNASGTAAVLVAADRLRTLLANANDRRTVLITLFSAEETGLGGSSYLVAHSPVPLDKIVAMINLDMVGALRDDKLIALGSETAPEWKPLIERVGGELKLKVAASGDGYGPSDQTSFYAKQIPVIHFFTGTHDRYHTPEDDADFVNFAGAEHVAEMTARVAASIANGETNPKYTRAIAAAPAMEGDSRGYGAYLGTVPDYSAMESSGGGVKLADVRPGGPADKAGIRGGDTIVSMAGTKIENLYDMTYALQDHKPGETIDVVVIRNGEHVTLHATLGSRKPDSAPGGGGHGAVALEIKAGKPFEKTFDGEKHLKDVRQLTFGGENAEAYFSPDGKKLIYQSTAERGGCDQQYVVNLATGETKMVSSGKGRTTCGYFRYPSGDRIIYATTEGAGEACPPPPDRSKGYIWGVYDSFDIYSANVDGSDKRRLTLTPGYDAEGVYCHKGGKILFTSVRDGDLDLYEMNENGGDVKRITNTPGYDGGGFYNADCTEIVWRAGRPTGAALDEYRALLRDGWVKPLQMELFTANADGTNARQITKNGAANFCPYFHPDGKRILYSTNAGDPHGGHQFDIWMIAKDGSGAEQVTTAPGFDGFPMFSPDGQWLVFASNRAQPEGRETNLFIARWSE
ncbi:MAG TPA: M28 family peptidase, partial [Thermoanaerobaculia bacterium]|nr:M28 family peptidase [Thermoanaerobaculia bacterium]